MGFFGVSVSGAGDVNRDIFADRLIGAFDLATGVRRVKLYRGLGGRLAATASLVFVVLAGSHAFVGWTVASRETLRPACPAPSVCVPMTVESVERHGLGRSGSGEI